MKCVSCGIFQYELERVLPEIEAELGIRVDVEYLEMALDADAELLEKAVSEKLNACLAGAASTSAADDFSGRRRNSGSAAKNTGEKPLLLYGSMCHTEWPRITAGSGAVYPAPANCAEMLIGPEKKRELQSEGDAYFLTSTSFKNWKDIFIRMRRMDEFTARQNFCYFQKVIVLDAGLFQFTDEELFEFFEFTQVPVELLPITLDYFKGIVKELCQKQRQAPLFAGRS
ncbi:MAG: DUF1638 domain-containing protein [Spirochaetaceae bacterium]|jgi:hypothetical protein|nr:DUF1638 domain-containing protein [Spirochaetaceae bacterium]